MRNHVIGDVKQVTIGSPPGLATGDHAPEPVPEWLDWDLFQGPAPDKAHTSWRWARSKKTKNLASWYFISDYSKAGWVAGYGVHDIDVHLYESNQHEGNFIECCKSRKPTITPVEAAHRATSLALAGGICLKLDRKLTWDPKSERFAGDNEANALLGYTMRDPWKL